MSENDAPPLVDTCHCTVGLGLPLAAAVKLAGWPASTVVLTGEVVTVGPSSTVRPTALVVVDPTELVKTAWYSFPFSASVVAKARVPVVAPAMLEKVAPPSV